MIGDIGTVIGNYYKDKTEGKLRYTHYIISRTAHLIFIYLLVSLAISLAFSLYFSDRYQYIYTDE
jgi:hypothetical protein